MRKDLSGQRFGKLVAIRPLRTEQKLGTIWLCQCDCGNEAEIPISRLTSGNTKSCGYIKAKQKEKQEITGQRFGRLTATQATEQRDAAGSVIWECDCDCGGIAYYSVSKLRQGKVKSCGCLRKHKQSQKENMVSE